MNMAHLLREEETKGTLGVFFCGAHAIAHQLQVAALKHMHDQFQFRTENGKLAFEGFTRIAVRKENF